MSIPKHQPEGAPALDRASALDSGILEATGTGTGAARLLELFLSDTPGRIEELRAAAARDDRESLRQVAHYLRSSALCVGANYMCARCAELENLPTTSPRADAAAVAAAVSDAFDAARSAAHDWLARAKERR